MTAHRRRLRLAAASVGLAVVATVSLGAAPASAADPNWWYGSYGVADFAAQGFDGSGVRIAVLDGQIDPSLPEFADADLTVDEDTMCSGSVTADASDEETLHGSDVTSILVGNGTGQSGQVGIAPGASVTFYGYGPDAYQCVTGPTVGFGEALRHAVAGGAQIVTTSYGFGDPSPSDISATAQALAAGVIIVAADPNDRSLGGGATPQEMNGVIAVSAFQSDLTLLTDTYSGEPNVWPNTTVAAPGSDIVSVDPEERALVSGTSLATPMVAGILALARQKWPAATPNQLVQSLIHNTTGSDGTARHSSDGYGYGPASLRGIMAADPTQYPDENPLLDKPLDVPTVEEIAAAATPTPTPVADAAGSPWAGAGIMAWIVGGAIGVVVVLALVTVVVIVIVRRGRRDVGRSSP